MRLIQAKDVNIDTLGEGDTLITYHYRALTVDECAALANEALLKFNSKYMVDFPKVARMAVTLLEGLDDENGNPVRTIEALGKQKDVSGAGYILQAMGMRIWNLANGIDTKKL